MKWLAVAFVLLAAAPVLAQTSSGSSTAMTPTPDDRAKQWLILVDDQNYADAYKQMGVTARDKSSADNWSKKVGALRAPMGAVSSRTLKDVKLSKNRPGMRDGQNATVRYESGFAHKTGSVESVTLISENGGWSVIGYSIN